MRELGDLPVFLGGPVSSDQLTFASINWDANAADIKAALSAIPISSDRHHCCHHVLVLCNPLILKYLNFWIKGPSVYF